MKTCEQTHDLLDQRLALSAYFDALLCPTVAPAPTPVAAPQLVVVPAPAPAAASVEAALETPVVTPEAMTVAPEVQTSPELTAQEAPVPLSATPSGRPAGRPEWAEAPFQALMFKVAGISLALPLARLNGVIPIGDEPEALCPMPGHADWFLGVLPYQECQVKVVDTGHLILPENRRALHRPGSASHIILIDDMRWGLACESIGEMVTLEPGQIRWRGEQGKRPWLAGTVIDRLCALLDADGLAQQLLMGQ